MIRSNNLEYINVGDALKLLGGYEQIYKKLVDTFIDNQKDLIYEVEEKLASNDRKEARRLVHSCKGISKNLGANRLYEESADFELAILNEEETNESLQSYFIRFKEVFEMTYQELQEISHS